MKYIDVDSDLFPKLLDSSFKIVEIDRWNNPNIEIPFNTSFEDYFDSRGSRLKRTCKALLKSTDEEFKYIESRQSNSDSTSLYTDMLKVDELSWKKSEGSDMKSLNREDLQYLPFLNNSPHNISLMVSYSNGRPFAYSMMIRRFLGKKWFSVKWGCSNYGRENSAGIKLLLKHVELLKNEAIENKFDLMIDLWGRNSEAYDQFKTSSNERVHLEVINKF